MHTTKTGARNSAADQNRLDAIGPHLDAIAGHVAAVKALHAQLNNSDPESPSEDATDTASEKARHGYAAPVEAAILHEIRKGRLK